MKRHLAAAFLSAAAMIWLSAAPLASAESKTDCEKLRGEASIAACNKDIASGRYKGKDLANLLSLRGYEYQQKGDFERALADVDEATRLDPALSRAYYVRGLVFRKQKKHDRAAKELTTCIELEPERTRCYAERAWVHIDAGNYQLALSDGDKALSLAPDDIGVLLERGRIRMHSRSGKLAEAFQDFDEAVRRAPDNVDALLTRAYYNNFWNRLPKAIADADAALKLNPKLAEAYEIRARARTRLRDLSQLPKALADFRQAKRLDPSRQDLAWTVPSEAVNIGDTLEQKGDLDGALQAYRAAIPLYEADPILVYEKIASVHLKRKEFDEAIANFSIAIERDKQNAGYWYSRCHAKLDRGDPLEQAMADCDTGVKVSAGEEHRHYRLQRSIVYLRRNLPDQALKDIDRVLAEEPDHEQAKVLKAVFLLQRQQFNELIALTSSALKSDERQAWALHLRGLAKRKTGGPADGDADIAAARKIAARIAEELAEIGVKP